MPSKYARMALSITDKAKRREVAEQHGVLDEVLSFWNGGRVCGQCKYFTQLGGRGSSCNGMCQVVQKRDYTKPSEEACNRFERAE
ncbi:MAG: hypothetical protein DSZ27_08490 [Thiomicrospira sp.]|nr:MAG: hypothetical protein DSZ27_08490 [Thiomicrospira sp.]